MPSLFYQARFGEAFNLLLHGYQTNDIHPLMDAVRDGLYDDNMPLLYMIRFSALASAGFWFIGNVEAFQVCSASSFRIVVKSN
jgi:hypothetical protein